ncbi:hypothetical protein GTY88_01175, partial [Streptomyces sp. SID5926]|nr:hypothetical protein [Streptomyces sp. SID5926]
ARRRSTRKATTGFAAPAQTAAASDEAEAPKRPSRPAVAVFQAPVFAEPQFQTPERAAAEAAAEAAGAETAKPAEESVEAAPEEQSAASRRRRKRRGAAA